MIARRKAAPPAPYQRPVNDRRTASITPWELLLDPRLRPMTKLIAGVLGGFMNDRAECNPGQDELARIAGVGVRTVQRAIAQLVATFWLEVELRSRGAVKKPSLYRWRHPEHGPMKTIRGPLQVSATMLTLSRPRTSPMAAARATDDGSAHDTGGGQTTAKLSNDPGRKRDRSTAPRDRAPEPIGEIELDPLGPGSVWHRTKNSLRPSSLSPADPQLGIGL